MPINLGRALAKAIAQDVSSSPVLQRMVHRGLSPWEFQGLVAGELQKVDLPGKADPNPLFPRVARLYADLKKEAAQERRSPRGSSRRTDGGMGAAAVDPYAAIIGAIGSVAGTVITVTQNRQIAEAQKKSAEAQLEQQRIALEQQKLAIAAQEAEAKRIREGSSASSGESSTLEKLALPAAIVAGGAVALKVGGVI